MTVRRYSVYGLTFETDHPFSYPVPPGSSRPQLRFDCRVGDPAPEWWAGAEEVLHEDFDHGGAVTWYRSPGGELIDIRGISQFRVRDHQIDCVARNPDVVPLVEIQLLGLVLAFWLERQGIPAVHASAVVRRGGAYGFIAPGGGGKTTIAATLVAVGNQLLTDDLLVVRSEGDGPMASPGYPQYRMWPADARQFVEDAAASQRAHPGFDKRRVAAETLAGGFHTASVPLRAFYFLDRAVSRQDDGISIEKAPVGAGVLTLLGNLMLADVVQAFGWSPQRLRQFADLCAGISIRTLRYPDDHARLPDVRRAVLADMDRQQVGAERGHL